MRRASFRGPSLLSPLRVWSSRRPPRGPSGCRGDPSGSAWSIGADWRIIHEVRLNHGVGLGFADGATVTGNFIHHRGQLGFGAWGTGSVVGSDEISFNGTAVLREWEAGGSKSWQTDRETIVHNYVHNNWGPGLWADGGTMDTRYEYNKITDNWAAGIRHEISYDATIRHNEVSGNGRSHKGWAWEAGIAIQSSGGAQLIDIAYNVVENNETELLSLTVVGVTTRIRNPMGSHVVRNVRVHDNIVTMSAGQATGAFEGWRRPTNLHKSHEFEANTYYRDSLDEPHFDWLSQS